MGLQSYHYKADLYPDWERGRAIGDGIVNAIKSGIVQGDYEVALVNRALDEAADIRRFEQASRRCEQPRTFWSKKGRRYGPCLCCTLCMAIHPKAGNIRAIKRNAFFADRIWWVTLTTSRKKLRRAGRPDNSLEWLDVRNYIRRLRHSGLDFTWTGALERGELGRLHAHLMIFCRADTRKEDVQSKWTLGRTKVTLTKDETTLAGYLAKYVTKEGSLRSSSDFVSGMATAKICAPHLAAAAEAVSTPAEVSQFWTKDQGKAVLSTAWASHLLEPPMPF